MDLKKKHELNEFWTAALNLVSNYTLPSSVQPSLWTLLYIPTFMLNKNLQNDHIL